MKTKIYNYNSIAFKLATTIIASVFIQCVLMSTTLIIGGVIEQAKNDSFQSFSEQTDKRKIDLESEMNNLWTSFSQYMEPILDILSDYGKNSTDLNATESILKDISPHLINILRSTKTTGAFVILNDNNKTDNKHSALYIYDDDPNRSNGDNSDIYLLSGPLSTAQALGIYRSEDWTFKLQLTDTSEGFYKKPYENAKLNENLKLTENLKLLSYWSPPFHIANNDKNIITYSLPLINDQGDPIGVIGIEISLNYLYKFLPKTDFQSKDSMSYIIGIKNHENSSIHPLISQGSMQSIILNLKEGLFMTQQEKTEDIYLLNNHNYENKIYSCVKKLGLYYTNTPFDNEEWYLINLMNENMLMQFPNKIKAILATSFFICLILGILIAVIISKWFTRPIINLAKEVNENQSGQFSNLKSTGLSEIDDLSGSINVSQKRFIELSSKLSRIIELTNLQFGAFELNENSNVVFTTNKLPKLFNLTAEEEIEVCSNKNKFIEKLDEICKNTCDEPNTFHLVDINNDKWIRITKTTIENSIIGVVMDVTEETLQTLNIKLERDKDPLTGIRNRLAYNTIISNYNKNLSSIKYIGIGIFDLNNLKNINDSFGHSIGDKYICDSAHIICEAFPKSPVFRIGGDEFAAIFIEINDGAINKLHSNMLSDIEEYNNNEENEIKIGIAFGYSLYNHEIDFDLSDVFSRADINMYLDKEKLKTTI